MKKLLALLLSLVLPVCALAETYEMTLQVSTDDEVFPAYAKALLQRIPGMTAQDADKYANMLRALLKNSAVTAIVQDDAVSLDVSLAGGSLFDMVTYEAENASYLTSSLLPGYALVEALTDAESMPALISEEDMLHAGDSVEAAITSWFAGIEPLTTSGVFSGDTYEGGTQCTTWILTDKDVAAYVSAIATDEIRSIWSQMLSGAEVNADDLFARFDEANEHVADEDKHSYVLRVVRDDADQLVGLSLTIIDEVAQIATLSLGVKDKEIRLVMGLGLGSQNYWWECTVQENQRSHLTLLKGTSREWVADKLETFAYVSETNAPVAAYTWSCNVTQSGQRYLWDGTAYEGEITDASRTICSFSGSVNQNTSALEANINLASAGRTPLKIKLNYKPVEEIPPLDPALTLCSIADPEQAELYTELSQQINYEMTLRLIKLLPLDVILTLSDFLAF